MWASVGPNGPVWGWSCFLGGLGRGSFLFALSAFLFAFGAFLFALGGGFGFLNLGFGGGFGLRFGFGGGFGLRLGGGGGGDRGGLFGEGGFVAHAFGGVSQPFGGLFFGGEALALVVVDGVDTVVVDAHRGVAHRGEGVGHAGEVFEVEGDLGAVGRGQHEDFAVEFEVSLAQSVEQGGGGDRGGAEAFESEVAFDTVFDGEASVDVVEGASFFDHDAIGVDHGDLGALEEFGELGVGLEAGVLFLHDCSPALFLGALLGSCAKVRCGVFASC